MRGCVLGQPSRIASLGKPLRQSFLRLVKRLLGLREFLPEPSQRPRPRAAAPLMYRPMLRSQPLASTSVSGTSRTSAPPSPSGSAPERYAATSASTSSGPHVVLVAALGEPLRPVDEQDMPSTLGGLGRPEDQEAGRDAGRVEQVRREAHDGIEPVGTKEALADGALGAAHGTGRRAASRRRPGR
jgi:hypothetical protein